MTNVYQLMVWKKGFRVTNLTKIEEVSSIIICDYDLWWLISF